MTKADVRDTLQAELVRAMRARDRRRTSTCRTALAALDNATAVTRDCAGAADAQVGAGAGEAERRVLSEEDVRRLLVREADELREAAVHQTGEAAEATVAEARYLDEVARS